MKDPLKCELKGGKLVISIGIDTLAFAAALSPQSNIWHGDSYISDNKQFAKDVVKELLRENEVGESLLTKTLDSAMTMTENRGSAAIKFL